MATSIRAIEIAGFRGAKGRLSVMLGSGFTVIAGRNGSGKSTLIDAIEFGLSGRFARPTDEPESGETLRDYIWWRGAEESQIEKYVRLAILDENGLTRQIVRTPETADTPQFLSDLIDEHAAPKDAIETLLLTTIIRDESIARLSMDLNETKRFDFIKRAIGLSESLGLEQGADALHDECETIIARLERNYATIRERINTLEEELSSAKAVAERSSNLTIDEIRSRMSAFVDKPAETVNALLEQGNAVLRNMRARIDKISALQSSYSALDRRTNDLAERSGQKAVDELRLRIDAKAAERQEVQTELSTVMNHVEQYVKLDDEELRLSELVAAGEAIGLKDGHCPLCGSEVGVEQFAAHIASTKASLDQRAQRVAALRTQASQLQSSIRRIDMDVAEMSSQLREIERIQNDLAERRRVLDRERAEVLGDRSDSDTSRLVLELSANIQNLESLLADVLASLTLDNVVRLERELAAAKRDSDEVNSEMQQTREALRYATDVQRASKKATMELIDDRVSALLPLLKELYVRIRPHVKWQDIDVRLRGDVRGFMRFLVGEELNPRFIYSSGQRRALGLAFLLAVHLGRRWCKLKTLVLDDPIQHIDDYRALHLVEVLSSLRKIGRQIVCAVEDGAIADLLCRRLLSSDADGRRIDLRFDVCDGIMLTNEQHVESLPTHALLTA